MKKSDDDAEKKKEEGGSYEVGFGKPPKDNQFKTGQSGNPNGRPKGKQNMDTVILREALAMVTINVNGQRRKVPKFVAAMMQLTNKAAGGDLRAMSELVNLLRRAEENHMNLNNSQKSGLGEIGQTVIEDLMRRFDSTFQGGNTDENNS